MRRYTVGLGGLLATFLWVAPGCGGHSGGGGDGGLPDGTATDGAADIGTVCDSGSGTSHNAP